MIKWSGAAYKFGEFCRLADELARLRRIDSPSFLFNLQKRILDHFFGMDWFEKFASENSPRGSYLRPSFDIPGGDIDFSMRLLNLSEMLWNLQGVDGVLNPIKDIANGQIEPGLAELQVGMLLMKNGHKFRFVDRVAGKRTYDIEIAGTPRPWPTEIKCKIDGTDLSETTIVSALQKAHDQLPPDDSGGGIVFMRCPRSWVVVGTNGIWLPPETITAVNAYVQSTRRIGLVVPYIFDYERRPTHFLVNFVVREVPSHRHPELIWWKRRLLPMDDHGQWEAWPALVDRWSSSRKANSAHS